MMMPRLVLVAIITLTAMSAQAAERRDILPGEANWHRYRFYVVTSQIAVRQHITVLWDNAGAGLLIGVYDINNAAAPKLVALSAGNDRLAALDVGLLAGSYQLVIGAASAGTHYHLNSTYGLNELLFAQNVRPGMSAADIYMERLIEEDFAPYVARMAGAMTTR
ncbi:MAG: hypothetical protein A3J29_06270 [Acidobacteria bacterium RIFCSPLOWO2_12_FULL_67_14b]|nr:MAG: hypothetical protein A3J29_06270 [Acidobacteria bacterium RIFCSPLOWO2_12_FULL_67_14b]